MLGFGQGLAREVGHDTANSPRHLRRLIRVWVEAHHGGGGIGSRQRGDLARAEEKGEGKWARRAPYHPRKLQRRLEVKNWQRRGRIAVAQGRVDSSATLGSSDGTAAQGLGESWGVQRRLREGAKERLRLRRSWGRLGVWVAHATDATHPAGSLRLAQIGARGGFLEGSRRGRGRRAGSDWMRRGGEGPGAEEWPWRIGPAK
jgi:hypothetical protein